MRVSVSSAPGFFIREAAERIPLTLVSCGFVCGSDDLVIRGKL